MNAHRFFGEGEIRSIPHARSTAVTAQGFMVCPSPFLARFDGAEMPGMGAQAIYQLAYEQAKASIAPPWHLKSLLAGVN